MTSIQPSEASYSEPSFKMDCFSDVKDSDYFDFEAYLEELTSTTVVQKINEKIHKPLPEEHQLTGEKSLDRIDFVDSTTKLASKRSLDPVAQVLPKDPIDAEVISEVNLVTESEVTLEEVSEDTIGDIDTGMLLTMC